MNTNTICKCGETAGDGTTLQLISKNPYSHTNTNYQRIEAYSLFDGWKLYEDEISWSEWFMSYLYNQPIESPLTKYIFNLETGEVYLLCHLVDYKLVIVGQFGQETEDPYIYMEDSSYIRVLPKYNSVIQNSPYAKKCQQKYIDRIKDDV
jgi:hypothetical protein